MIYWKMNEYTIRCLLHKEEMDQMGFELNEIKKDKKMLDRLIHTIVDTSHKYIEWNTENGVQNYTAKILPANQFLVTISCTNQENEEETDMPKELQSSGEQVESKAKSVSRQNRGFPPYKITFHSIDTLLQFCSQLGKKHFYPSRLYRYRGKYHLMLTFEKELDKVDIITFLMTAEEFGGKCESRMFEEHFFKEHAELMIPENAIEVLYALR